MVDEDKAVKAFGRFRVTNIDEARIEMDLRDDDGTGCPIRKFPLSITEVKSTA